MQALDMALRIASRYPVFPCRADKKPACKHGFKDAVREPSAIVDLWRATPGPLIGVPTGEVSGIDALDIDPRHDGDVWLKEFVDALPITRIHRTRSGGWHYLFAHGHGVRNTAGKIAPGTDTRGDGGYIIWWPADGCAVENRNIIDDWPKWLLRILIPPKVNRPPPPVPATIAEANTRAARMIDNAFNRVRAAAPGQRHYELRAAAATLGGLIRFMPEGASSVQRLLVELIMATGAEDQANAEKTAHWAMEKGAKSQLLAGR